MRRLALAALGAAILSGCGPTGSLTPAQTLEQADTGAALSYASVATAVNAYIAANPANPAAVAKGQALKAQAWAILARS